MGTTDGRLAVSAVAKRAMRWELMNRTTGCSSSIAIFNRMLQFTEFQHRDRFSHWRFPCELALPCLSLDPLEGLTQLRELLVVRKNWASTVFGYSIDYSTP